MARFAINKNFNILGELLFINANMEVDNENERTNTRYDFAALFLGIDVGY
ncbi:MAG: hypothetical protein KAJ16_03505 [Calditrichia bacterium]|nr:hypothetical protein [Calditrichia bacterium]